MYTLQTKGRLLLLDTPKVMGIINATPDSFYAGSRVGLSEALAVAAQMAEDGASMLDIGGQSTRPGSQRVAAAEEADRVLPIVDAISKQLPDLFISIDTYHASVARQAVQAGAHLVNDVSGGLMDADMLQEVGKLKVPYICMHMQGRPETMQDHPQYDDVVTTVTDFFIERLEACRLAGIHDVVLDVGFGFGKTADHNFTLLRRLREFEWLQRPMLLGVSRKGMIWKTLGTSPEEALNGSTVLHTIGLLQGAQILRVHDVRESMEAIKLTQALKGS